MPEGIPAQRPFSLGTWAPAWGWGQILRPSPAKIWGVEAQDPPPPAGSGPHFIVSAQLPSQQPSEEAAGGAEGFDLFKTLPGVQTSLFYCSSERMNHGRCGKVTALFRATRET